MSSHNIQTKTRSGEQLSSILHCPICSTDMELHHHSLICEQRHTFDIARGGYVNVLKRPASVKYTKALFEARQGISKSGLFAGLDQCIAQMIEEHWLAAAAPLPDILDAGCGEGSRLLHIQQQLLASTARVNQPEPLLAGFDIAKEGVALACKHRLNAAWFVADLAQCPVKDRTFDVILNILSPSHYGQFSRILRPEGIVVKVVPEQSYLKELREGLYSSTAKQQYEGSDDSKQQFADHFQLVATKRVTEKLTLSTDQIEQLLQMTPLAWHAEAALIAAMKQRDQMEITVDLTVLVGK